MENGKWRRKKRTLLTRALIKKPKLLILDEPFNHLDEESKKLVTHSLIDYVSAKRGSLIMVSHENSDEQFRGAGVKLKKIDLGRT